MDYVMAIFRDQFSGDEKPLLACVKNNVMKQGNENSSW